MQQFGNYYTHEFEYPQKRNKQLSLKKIKNEKRDTTKLKRNNYTM